MECLKCFWKRWSLDPNPWAQSPSFLLCRSLDGNDRTTIQCVQIQHKPFKLNSKWVGTFGLGCLNSQMTWGFHFWICQIYITLMFICSCYLSRLTPSPLSPTLAALSGWSANIGKHTSGTWPVLWSENITFCQKKSVVTLWKTDSITPFMPQWLTKSLVLGSAEMGEAWCNETRK